MPLADSITVTAPAVFFTLAAAFGVTGLDAALALAFGPQSGAPHWLNRASLVVSCLGAAFCLHIALLP